jgi:phage terminase small subunit
MATKKKPAAKKVKPGTSKESAETRKKLFVEAYIANSGNATAAAEAAGYSPGPSARVQGSRMLADPNIASMIEARTKKLVDKFELTTEAVLRNLSQAIFFDPRKLYREDGSLKDVHELDDDTAMALAGLEVTEEKGSGDDRGKVVGYTKKLKWLDKNSAREQAMKHLGQYREDNNQRNPLADVPRESLKALVDRLKGAAAGG